MATQNDDVKGLNSYCILNHRYVHWTWTHLEQLSGVWTNLSSDHWDHEPIHCYSYCGTAACGNPLPFSLLFCQNVTRCFVSFVSLASFLVVSSPVELAVLVALEEAHAEPNGMVQGIHSWPCLGWCFHVFSLRYLGFHDDMDRGNLDIIIMTPHSTILNQSTTIS